MKPVSEVIKNKTHTRNTLNTRNGCNLDCKQSYFVYPHYTKLHEIEKDALSAQVMAGKNTNESLQLSGATQNTPAMPEHTSIEQNALQATPAQRPENDAERLAAWERGEWVTIPHTAESLEIYRALELEHMARQIGRLEVADELSRALATIDQIDQQQRPDDFAFALLVLRSATEDAACHLSREQKQAAA